MVNLKCLRGVRCKTYWDSGLLIASLLLSTGPTANAQDSVHENFSFPNYWSDDVFLAKGATPQGACHQELMRSISRLRDLDEPETRSLNAFVGYFKKELGISGKILISPQFTIYPKERQAFSQTFARVDSSFVTFVESQVFHPAVKYCPDNGNGYCLRREAYSSPGPLLPQRATVTRYEPNLNKLDPWLDLDQENTVSRQEEPSKNRVTSRVRYDFNGMAPSAVLLRWESDLSDYPKVRQLSESIGRDLGDAYKNQNKVEAQLAQNQRLFNSIQSMNRRTLGFKQDSLMQAIQDLESRSALINHAEKRLKEYLNPPRAMTWNSPFRNYGNLGSIAYGKLSDQRPQRCAIYPDDIRAALQKILNEKRNEVRSKAEQVNQLMTKTQEQYLELQNQQALRQKKKSDVFTGKIAQ